MAHRIVRLSKNAKKKELVNEVKWGKDCLVVEYDDPFSFFENISYGDNLRYYVVESFQKRDILGSCVCLQKQFSIGDKLMKVWCFTNLKSHADHRETNPIIILRKIFPSLHNISLRGYIVLLDPQSRNIWEMIKGVTNFPLKIVQYRNKLLVYSLDYTNMKKAHKIIKRYKWSHVCYMKDKREITLRSINKPIKILHLQHGLHSNPTEIERPKKGYLHLFCCLENDPLVSKLEEYDIVTGVTASIFHRGMRGVNWNTILTHDILI